MVYTVRCLLLIARFISLCDWTCGIHYIQIVEVSIGVWDWTLTSHSVFSVSYWVPGMKVRCGCVVKDCWRRMPTTLLVRCAFAFAIWLNQRKFSDNELRIMDSVVNISLYLEDLCELGFEWRSGFLVN